MSRKSANFINFTKNGHCSIDMTAFSMYNIIKINWKLR